MTQKQLERQISQTYAQAQKEIAKYTEDYFKKFQVRDEDKRQQVADGIITEDEYQDWLTGQKAYMARNDQLLKSVTEEYENADKTAEKWINGELPYAYVEGYNATGRGIEGEVTGYSFSMIDKNAVKAMMKDGDIPITTYKSGTEKHTAYVSKKARQAITQGIIQGDSVKDVSKNVNKALGVVTDKERKATIRNTRTLMNSAHNSGAYESMAEASEDGIILDKQWLATKDERTRDSHAELDGEIVKWDEPFSNGLQFPQDYSGEPSEVYNCRCSYREIVRGFYNKYTGKTEMLSEVPEEEYAKRSQEYWSKANAEKEAKKPKAEERPKDKATIKQLAEAESPSYSNKLLDQKKPSVKWEDTLTADEESAIRNYVSGDGMWLNNELRGLSNVGLTEADKEYMRDLDNALAKTEINKKTKVYRSVDANAIFGNMSQSEYEDVISGYKELPKSVVGKTITDKGYMSTTKDKDIAVNWGDYTGSSKPITVELDVPQGAKGADLKAFDVEGDEQKEVLFARNTDYEITSVQVVEEEMEDEYGKYTEKYILVKAKILK